MELNNYMQTGLLKIGLALFFWGLGAETLLPYWHVVLWFLNLCEFLKLSEVILQDYLLELRHFTDLETEAQRKELARAAKRKGPDCYGHYNGPSLYTG